jgi:hypothetical protein
MEYEKENKMTIDSQLDENMNKSINSNESMSSSLMSPMNDTESGNLN